MSQMLMITVKFVLIIGSFRIDEIYVFVDITLCTFNFANVSNGLSSARWQQIQ